MKLISLLIAILSFLNLNSQDLDEYVVTADNYKLGTLKEFIDGCSKGAKETQSQMQWEGVEIDIKQFCKCMAIGVIGNLTKDEFLEKMSQGDLTTALSNKKIRKDFTNCIFNSGAMKLEDDFKYSNFNSNLSKEQEAIVLDYCVEKELEVDNSLDPKLVREFCKCKREKLIELDITFDKLYEIENTDKEAYNEIILPCFNSIITTKEEYNPDDLIGSNYFTRVSLIPIINSYKIKLEIDGVTRYFVFDTGADQMLINSDLEKELLSKNKISKNDYIESMPFEMADGSIVLARGVLLNNIKIGSYFVNNVKAYIVPEGSPLCGMGFLNKFKKWEIDVEKNELLLFK